MHVETMKPKRNSKKIKIVKNHKGKMDQIKDRKS